jgi:hypothetical protein
MLAYLSFTLDGSESPLHPPTWAMDAFHSRMDALLDGEGGVILSLPGTVQIHEQGSYILPYQRLLPRFLNIPHQEKNFSLLTLPVQ